MRVATNQREGQIAYQVDEVEAGENPHVNYEPSSMGGLKEVPSLEKIVLLKFKV